MHENFGGLSLQELFTQPVEKLQKSEKLEPEKIQCHMVCS